MYRILACDGGGIRGVIAAVILERIERAVAGWLDRVDLIAGTSTGGVIALALAAGIEPAVVRRMYVEQGSSLFQDSPVRHALNLGRAVGAQYRNSHLIELLKAMFGMSRLRDLKKHVLVPAFDLDNGERRRWQRSWKPKFFHNFPGNDSDGNVLVWKVAMATSAAPTYFPSFEGYIDGGVVANNPSMAAVAQAMDTRFRHGQRLEDIALISLGTGHSPAFIPGNRHDWGIAQWGRPVVDIMVDGVMGVADYQCRQILRGRYCRIDPTLARPWRLDDINAVKDMVTCATQADIGAALRWLKKRWARGD